MTYPESMDKQMERERYESRADKALCSLEYATFGANGAGYLPHILRAPYLWYEQQLEHMLQSHHDVLEIGAGTGLHTGILLKSGANVMASDISEKSLTVIKKRYEKFDNLKTMVADMEHLPFEEASFDFVVSAGSLSYGDNQQVMREILRVLKPAGCFVCVDSLNHNPVYRFNRWLHYLRGNRTKSTLQRMPTLQTIAQYSHVFDTTDVRYYGSLFWLISFATVLLSDVKAAKLLDWTDKILDVRGSAFKFVMIAKGKKVNEQLKVGDLGELSDPAYLHEPINTGDNSPEILQHYLQQMVRIRKVEQKLAEGRRLGLIGGPVHLGVGQEAVAVGVSAALRNTDRIFGAHRSHSHLLALGSDIHGLFAEVLGKDTGLSRGMGGSMHLWDQAKGFYGSVPIVAGTVPLAVGAALAAKMQKKGDVAVAYFGDGAMEEGVVHESMNLARILNAPILFVVENNLFSSHMHISVRQPKSATSRFAEANDIPFRLVDGNDVVAVANASTELVDHARSGKGPGFIEAVTFRWYGHVDWREDVDVGIHRSQVELANWRARDPVQRLRHAMLENGSWTQEMDQRLETGLNQKITDAWEQAMRDPYPESETLLKRVYQQ